MRKHPVLVAAVTLGVVIIGALLALPQRAPKARIAYPPIVASLPVFIAEDRQLFEKDDIVAEVVQFTNSNDMVNALVAGQMDVLPAVSLVPLIHLEIQFPRSVRLFSHSRMVPDRAFDSIIVAQNSDLGQLRDLETRTVGVFPGTSATNMLKAFFARQGVDSTKITFVPLAPAAHLSSLDSGAVDALFTYEPVTTAADASGRYRKLFGSVYADLQNPCPIGASAVSRRFEREHPELARRTISAIDEAVTMMREDPQTSKTLLSSRLGFSDGIAKQVNVVDVTLSSEVDVDSLQRFIDLPTDH